MSRIFLWRNLSFMGIQGKRIYIHWNLMLNFDLKGLKIRHNEPMQPMSGMVIKGCMVDTGVVYKERM